MNRKGFTLIELIAVVVVLAVVLVVAAPSLIDVFKGSKLKSEEAFAERLTQTIDSYIKLNSGGIIFISDGTATKEEEGTTYTVNVLKGIITIQSVFEDKLISPEDYINPGNEGVSCNINAEIEVYKDSDYVYCHKVNKSSLGCLTDEYKNSITGDYVIDTCIWSK